ncbi:hypothetical protein GCM10017784_30460 [Deinococcus indicus]|uniref:hypothetical protein n=1 Tax=Deinococcus indicus TaxID=223556 RepID=UPI001749BF3D|nr:hypothetical protein [Deinococcus indicus]GHG34533.1 hypothetical protein GCM10017784_30460 [Deinococcus indicus]
MTTIRITEDHRGARIVQPVVTAQPPQNRRVLTPGVVVRMTHLGRVLEAREQARRVCGVGESVTTR